MGNFNKQFGVEFDVSGYYKRYNFAINTPLVAGTFGVNVRDYSYLAGPLVSFRPLFLHALLGGDHLSGSTSGYSASQDGFAGAFGGGIQQKVGGFWSIRVSADYVFSRHNIFGGSSYTQNNFRTAVGIAYSFGGNRPVASYRPKASRMPEQSAGMSVPSLGIVGSGRSEGGVVIMEVVPGGVAELAFLHVRDVITSLDGKPVNTPVELAAMLQDRPSGSQVRLGYLFRTSALGYLPQEKILVLK